MTSDAWSVILAFVVAPAVVAALGYAAVRLHERGPR